MSTATTTPTRRSGRWIDDWRPEDPEFWDSTGAPVARRNLIWSILAEHLGFSVWLFWSVSAAMLAKMGFDFSVSQLFLLVAVPNLIGSLLRPGTTGLQLAYRLTRLNHSAPFIMLSMAADDIREAALTAGAVAVFPNASAPMCSSKPFKLHLSPGGARMDSKPHSDGILWLS